MKRPYHLFVCLGFTSMVCQVLLMRELVVVFYGNELSLGIMLGLWLLWVGVGSFVAGAVLPRLSVFRRLGLVAFMQAVLGFLCVATLLGVRLLRLVHGGTIGEIVGYVPIILSSFFVLAPICLLLGFLFALFCHLWSEQGAVSAITSVYLLEGLGAAVGGMVFAGVLVRFVNPVGIVFLVLVVNLAAAASILALDRRRLKMSALVLLMALIAAGPGFFGFAGKLRERSLAWLWRGLDVVDSRNSIYGNVMFGENLEQKALYENGLLLASYPDRFSAEESVHFAMLEHPNPKRLLLIGGVAGGSLAELLKHPVERIDYVELDPLIIKMVRDHFPSEVTETLDDPRVRIHNIDGRLFLKEAPGPYDVILVNLPDPYTAQLNRFYTLEFFRECAAKLASGGLLSFKVKSAENYISPELQQFLGCIYGTLREVFPDVKVIPGENNIFLAANAPGMLTLDKRVLVERLVERGIKDKLSFVREYYLPYRLSDDRMQTLSAALSVEVPRRNTDLSPVCFYYDAVLWSKQFKDISSRILEWTAGIPAALPLVIIGAIFVVGIISQWRFPGLWGSKSILTAVGATGFAEITIEVVTLLGFQAIHGYVYQEIAVIIAAFMVGLAAGAAVMAPIASSDRPKTRLFLVIQGVVCLYPLVLLGVLLIMAGGGASRFLSGLHLFRAAIVFPGLAFVAGVVGGLQFPLANALWLSEAGGAARAAGFTYGIDLLGSCLGAFFTTAFLVPIYGIPFACVTATVLNFGALILLLFKFVPAGLR